MIVKALSQMLGCSLTPCFCVSSLTWSNWSLSVDRIWDFKQTGNRCLIDQHCLILYYSTLFPDPNVLNWYQLWVLEFSPVHLCIFLWEWEWILFKTQVVYSQGERILCSLSRGKVHLMTFKWFPWSPLSFVLLFFYMNWTLVLGYKCTRAPWFPNLSLSSGYCLSSKGTIIWVR